MSQTGVPRPHDTPVPRILTYVYKVFEQKEGDNIIGAEGEGTLIQGHVVLVIKRVLLASCPLGNEKNPPELPFIPLQKFGIVIVALRNDKSVQVGKQKVTAWKVVEKGKNNFEGEPVYFDEHGCPREWKTQYNIQETSVVDLVTIIPQIVPVCKKVRDYWFWLKVVNVLHFLLVDYTQSLSFRQEWMFINMKIYQNYQTYPLVLCDKSLL